MLCAAAALLGGCATAAVLSAALGGSSCCREERLLGFQCLLGCLENNVGFLMFYFTSACQNAVAAVASIQMPRDSAV